MSNITTLRQIIDEIDEKLLDLEEIKYEREHNGTTEWSDPNEQRKLENYIEQLTKQLKQYVIENF